VDDILIIGNDEASYVDLIGRLNANLTGLTQQRGTDIHFLRILIGIRPHERAIYVSKVGHMKKLLEKYNVTKAYKTPCDSQVLEPDDSPSLPDFALSGIIMEIRHLVDCRPDLYFTLNVLTKSMHKPTKRLEQLAHRTLGYLLHTKDYRMRFAPEDLQLRAYVDASYGIHADCKSHYGVLLRVGHSYAAIHALSSIIKVVTRSALESELYAINDIASEILFECDISNEIGYLQGPTIVGEDNQGVARGCVRSMPYS
jgi:hypothetical protein